MKEINKKGFDNHLKEIKQGDKLKPHNEILSQLLNDVNPVDYEAKGKESMENKLKIPGLTSEEKEAIQEAMENFKLNEKHFLIISIDEIINLTKSKKWGICKNQDFLFV